jgi:DNA-binding HxlR family transcriptional regulator
MTTKVSIANRSQRARLRRLSVVFAIELRLKIVTELFMREMSPTQFYREFGGGSASRVASNFQSLQKDGWLRYVRSAPGKGGRGVENFYRATEPAFFDTETWALVPYSMRVASSWNIFNEIAPRLRMAIEASSPEEGLGRDLNCISLRLDEIGWERVVEAAGAQFTSLFEEQEDARLRVIHTGEELIRTDVFLIAFEAAARGDRRVASELVESHREPLVPFLERLSPVLADEVCMRIVAELNQREMSVTEFHREFGGATAGGIHRRFKRLAEIAWIERVKEATGGKRRGATEIFYRATRPAMQDNTPWADAPEWLRATDNWKTFERLSNQAKEAMRSGTFDERVDRYLTWSLLSLDRRGWEKIVAELDALHAYVLEEQDRAGRRMAKSGEKPIEMLVAKAAFEAPKDLAKAP